MPSQYDELESRMTAVEHELQRVRDDAAAARLLASEADRDVSVLGAKLDAHTKVLNALRETQLEMQHNINAGFVRIDQKFALIDQKFALIDQEFALVNQGFAKVEEQFAKLGAGMAHITTLLARIAEPE